AKDVSFQKNRLRIISSGFPEMSRQMPSKSMSIVCVNSSSTKAPGCRSTPYAASDISSLRKNVIRFKSIISRIVILHVIAVAITSILMSFALSWLLNLATNNIHNEAMAEQAASVADHLISQADGSLSLELPPDLQGLYSQPYGRYSYAVVDDHGNTLFSSLKDQAPIFAADPRFAVVQFLKTRKGEAAISGASVRRVVGTKTVWIQAAEDLANRDVLIDDIVADFFKNVGWITLPILLVLLVTDIAIFRRALLPLRQASEIAQQIGPAHTDVRLPG